MQFPLTLPFCSLGTMLIGAIILFRLSRIYLCSNVWGLRQSLCLEEITKHLHLLGHMGFMIRYAKSMETQLSGIILSRFFHIFLWQQSSIIQYFVFMEGFPPLYLSLITSTASIEWVISQNLGPWVTWSGQTLTFLTNKVGQSTAGELGLSSADM